MVYSNDICINKACFSDMENLAMLVEEARLQTDNETVIITEATRTIKTIYSNITKCYYQHCAIVTPPPISKKGEGRDIL